jgi:hypothetical protein
MTTVTVDSSDEELFSSDEEGEGDERAKNVRSSPRPMTITHLVQRNPG